MSTRQLIEERMRKLDMSQSKLARIVSRFLPSIDSSDVSKIVRGLRRVNADEVRYFAWALKCRTGDLMDPDIEEQPPEY